MTKNSKELIKVSGHYINIKQLFALQNKKIDLRKQLTASQKGQITKAVNKVKALGGAYSHEMVPMKKGRKKYLADNGLPPYMAGIFLPGGMKVNTNLQYIGGELQYKRGGSPRSRTELDTSGDENTLIASAEKILKNRKNRKTAITASGRVIGSAQGMRDNKTIIKEAAYIFNKYSTMNHNNESRERRNKDGTTYSQQAAHPSEWGMGILFEAPNKKPAKKKVKKNAK